MKQLSISIALITILIAFSSCKKKGCMDDTAENYTAEAEKDDGSCTYAETGTITLDFTQNVSGTNITATDFDLLNYTTPEGNIYSVTRLRYSISNVRFYRANGDSLMIAGYHLIDLSDSTTLNYELPNPIPTNPFTGIGFTFGFDETENISGQYNDLNAASWDVPEGMGGGYHQMQLEGKFIDDMTDTVPYLYHNISRSTVNANYAHINLGAPMTIAGNTTIEIKMNLTEWFQNPNTWDLDSLSTNLMGNYPAQLMMKENASTVFSVGAITE